MSKTTTLTLPEAKALTSSEVRQIKRKLQLKAIIEMAEKHIEKIDERINPIFEKELAGQKKTSVIVGNKIVEIVKVEQTKPSYKKIVEDALEAEVLDAYKANPEFQTECKYFKAKII